MKRGEILGGWGSSSHEGGRPGAHNPFDRIGSFKKRLSMRVHECVGCSGIGRVLEGGMGKVTGTPLKGALPTP